MGFFRPQAARLFFPDGDYKIYLSLEQPEEEIMAAGNPLDEEEVDQSTCLCLYYLKNKKAIRRVKGWKIRN